MEENVTHTNRNLIQLINYIIQHTKLEDEKCLCDLRFLIDRLSDEERKTFQNICNVHNTHVVSDYTKYKKIKCRK